jgi:tetraacyldisaccharide 4'-kinase
MKKLSSPEFWRQDGLAARLLSPLAWAHAEASRARWALAHPWRAPVPVVCVGNAVAGGAGKTPVAIALAERLVAHGLKPHLLSRGYGGREAGPLAVDPLRHDAAEVGDEPLLLARAAPTWVARDRVAGARAAIAAGAAILVMDDGLQNPSLAKDLSLLVVDGGYGFGNGRGLPAGPLREPLARTLGRADAVVLIGEDEAHVTPRLAGKRVLEARLVPVAGARVSGRVIAFAGIGRPEKFFRTLEAAGAAIVARRAFPDHHPYRAAELERLAGAAEDATLVTTAKDWVRLPEAWQRRVSVLEVTVEWRDAAALDALLAPVMERAHE